MDPLANAQIQNALAAARASAPVNGPRLTADQTPEAMRATAEEFEAVFLSQMVEQMMGPSTESSFGGGPGESAFKSMLNEELAKVMAKSGGIGLTDALAREMMAMQEIS